MGKQETGWENNGNQGASEEHRDESGFADLFAEVDNEILRNELKTQVAEIWGELQEIEEWFLAHQDNPVFSDVMKAGMKAIYDDLIAVREKLQKLEGSEKAA
jgi:hypothetical protein